MVETCILLGTLGLHSIEDIREHKITVTLTMFSGILAILLHLLFLNRSIFEMLCGMLTGVFLLALGYLTGGKIGTGDGLVFMLTGLYLGFYDNLALFCISFFLAGAYGLFLAAVRRCRREKRIPLVPFLFLGYCLMIVG